jgi:hypothetical protein
MSPKRQRAETLVSLKAIVSISIDDVLVLLNAELNADAEVSRLPQFVRVRWGSIRLGLDRRDSPR